MLRFFRGTKSKETKKSPPNETSSLLPTTTTPTDEPSETPGNYQTTSVSFTDPATSSFVEIKSSSNDPRQPRSPGYNVITSSFAVPVDGPHSIGYVGSFAIAINSLAGPAVLQLPFQYQQSGIIPTTLCLLLVAYLSCLCCLHMTNSIAQVDHNSQFTKSVEFSDVFRIFWNKRVYQITQILFFLCTLCLNIASIIDTAQVVDTTLGVATSLGTAGLQVGNPQAGWWERWHHLPCTRKEVKLGLCTPFQTEGDNSSDTDSSSVYILSVGYVLTALVFLPVCLMDLKENTAWQIWGCTLLITLCIYFCFDFVLNMDAHNGQHSMHHYINVSNLEHPHNATQGHHVPNVTLWGHDWSGMLGVILFNFALVLAIPAWVHEKKQHVSVQKVVYGSTAISTLLYIMVGLLAAWSIPHANVNMLSPMVSGAFGKGMQMAGSCFAFFIIGLDIPLFSVLTRYNLTHSGMFSTTTANIMVVWLPWALSWLLYQGNSVGELLDWGGVLLTSAIAFLLPLYLALRILKTTDTEGIIPVYGPFWRSRPSQIRALYGLLLITSIAVVIAIAGQFLADEETYLSSNAYLNGTNY